MTGSVLALALRVVCLAAACLAATGCGDSTSSQSQGGESGSATGQGGSASGSGGSGSSAGGSGGAGLGASWKSGTAGSSSVAGAASGGGASSLPPNACMGFPIDCIPLCQGGMCDCFCEHSAQCAAKPEVEGTCNNCYFDRHCADGERCYAAACGMQVDTPAPGTCRTPPGGAGCWGKEDCGISKVCQGAQICPCGSACLVADTPGTCQTP